MVPFLDLKAAYLELQREIDDAVARVLHSGWYILGSEVDEFEEDFAHRVGAKHCISVANGLDALSLSLRAMGVGPGDEVIVPSHTFIATWLAVSHCGATPIPVEPTQGGFQIDVERISQAVSPRTKVILPVHLYGAPVDVDPLLETARRNGLAVLEDAAQAHGANYKGRPIGSHGNAVAWSFYPGKNLGALGDGGAITTNDAQLAAHLRGLRNYGSTQKYVTDYIGFNSRLDPVQAAVLKVKLKHLDEWNLRRKAIAARYLSELADLEIDLPVVEDWSDPVWHLFVIRHKNRNTLQQRLAKEGVATLIHYPIAPHKQAAYGSTAWNLPLAETLANEVLSLPMGPHLSTPQVDQVISAVKKTCSLAHTQTG